MKLAILLSLFSLTHGEATTAAPTVGPCVKSEDQYKCTASGYYEMEQCDDIGCFCMNPLNGQIAFDTYTDSRTTKPTCSSCFQRLSELVKNGSPADAASVKKCDVVLGDFVPLQCNRADGFCSCVNTKTGEVIPDTKKAIAGNPVLKCDGRDFKIDDWYPTYERETKPRSLRNPAPRAECRLDRDRGQECTNATKSIKYYYEPILGACLAFEYLGCGGNGNRHDSRSACFSWCQMMDYSSCAFESLPARDENMNAFMCGRMRFQPIEPVAPVGQEPVKKTGPTLKEDGCPKGFRCSMGAFVGICCNQSLNDKLNAAYRPSCPNNGTALNEFSGGIPMLQIGKSCQDNFCPSDHTCQQGEIFAHCCR